MNGNSYNLLMVNYTSRINKC